MEPVANQLILNASVAQLSSLRYTPAGLPAIDLMLEHESSWMDDRQERKVRAVVKAVAFGSLAERLCNRPIGGLWRFTGYVATPRNGKHLVFHIQDFSQV